MGKQGAWVGHARTAASSPDGPPAATARGDDAGLKQAGGPAHRIAGEREAAGWTSTARLGPRAVELEGRIGRQAGASE